MTVSTISADWDTYDAPLPGWWAIQNPWNSGSLVNGTNYTQTVTVDSTSFPNRTILSWSWPNYANADNVWGYPEVVYGTQAGIWQSPDGQGPTPVQIKNLTALTGTYDLTLSGNTDQYDVLWETQLTSAPNSGQVDEFGIMSHAPSYVRAFVDGLSQKYSYSGPGLSGTIAVTSNGTDPYIIVLPNEDILSGTVDIKSILNFLTSKGVLTGNEYIEGFEMGAEPQQGSGSVTINSIGYDWNGNIVGNGTPSSSLSTPTLPAPSPPSSDPPPAGGPAPAITTGSGSNALALTISEDAYANGDATSDANGDAVFTVSVDGQQLGGTFTAGASHAAGADQTFTFKGDWAGGTHTVTIDFLNDAWGGTPAKDRNLYIDSVTYDGTNTNQSVALYGGGPRDFLVTDNTAVPPQIIGNGSDSLTVNVSEDSYLGDAQFTVSVDGKQIGETFTATTLRSTGKSQSFTFAGDFGPGQHNVDVKFVNDAWGGTSSTDRNLYVEDIIYNGTDTGQSASLFRNGTKTFTVDGGTTPSVTESGDHGSFSKNLSQTGTYDIGGDTFVLSNGNAATVTLGTGNSQIAFLGPSSLELTGGSGTSTVTSDTGRNTFTAGSGSLDVTGGSGQDTYVYHASSGTLIIEDFSSAKGDKLVLDRSLQASMQQVPDGEGGTLMTFGAGSGRFVDVHGVATIPSSSISWV